MAIRTTTVTVPEDIYVQLEAQARTTAQSVDDLVTQTLAQSMPPTGAGSVADRAG